MSGEIVSKKQEINVRVKKIFTDRTSIENTELIDTALFSDDLGIDSLDLFEILMEIEKEFQIHIPDEDAEKIHTVGSLIDYINKKY